MVLVFVSTNLFSVPVKINESLSARLSSEMSYSGENLSMSFNYEFCACFYCGVVSFEFGDGDSCIL